MKISCQEHLLPGDTLVEKFEFATSAGWDGIELRGSGDFQFEARLPELRAAHKAGVVMPTVCVAMDHFIGDFDADKRKDAVANLKSQLRVMAELGGRGAMTPASWAMFSRRLPPFIPPRSEEEDRKVLLEALHELGDEAQRAGVEIYLEPLNRYEDHMVNQLAQAVSLVQEVGLPSVRVVADFYHMNIEEVDMAASLRAALPHLGHVQVSDSNRLEPGAGHIDWRPGIAVLEAGGYTGYLALESRLSGPASEVLPRAAAFLRAQM
ncbi:MAG TPA: sugar phosphate isomerase/epimerase family protein [Streptosporangiaceae bacterium]